MPKVSGKKKTIFIVVLLLLSAVLLGLFLGRALVPASNKINVYFLKDGSLSAVERVPGKRATFAVVSEALNNGPTTEEKAAGFYTEIPDGAKILSVQKKGEMAVVDFNSKLETYGGGATRIQALIGQIVYSFTEISGIEEVKITVNGKDEVILGGEGYVIDKPLSRSDLTP